MHLDLSAMVYYVFDLFSLFIQHSANTLAAVWALDNHNTLLLESFMFRKQLFLLFINFPKI